MAETRVHAVLKRPPLRASADVKRVPRPQAQAQPKIKLSPKQRHVFVKQS